MSDNKKFVFDAQSVFLTFPKCDMDPQVVLDALVEKMNSDLSDYAPNAVSWAICAQEHHQDGSLHLHLVAKFAARYFTRDERCFDSIVGYTQHPNIAVSIYIQFVNSFKPK